MQNNHWFWHKRRFISHSFAEPTCHNNNWYFKVIRDFLDFWDEKVDGGNWIDGQWRGGSMWEYLNINRDEFGEDWDWDKQYDTVLKRLQFLEMKAPNYFKILQKSNR